MIKERLSTEEYTCQLLRWVADQMSKDSRAVTVGVSNRHIHLSRADMDVLFGSSSELTRMKDLGQPGQYAAKETVTLRGTKGELGRVRVLGPLRSETQVEISVADGYQLGVTAPIRDSGQLDNTPGIEIIGPKGSVKKERGVIIAKRHIHMTPEDAERYGLQDKQLIDVMIEGARGAMLNQVLIRVSKQFALEMHIDVEEANALGIRSGDAAYMMLPPEFV